MTTSCSGIIRQKVKGMAYVDYHLCRNPSGRKLIPLFQFALRVNILTSRNPSPIPPSFAFQFESFVRYRYRLRPIRTHRNWRRGQGHSGTACSRLSVGVFAASPDRKKMQSGSFQCKCQLLRSVCYERDLDAAVLASPNTRIRVEQRCSRRVAPFR